MFIYSLLLSALFWSSLFSMNKQPSKKQTAEEHSDAPTTQMPRIADEEVEAFYPIKPLTKLPAWQKFQDPRLGTTSPHYQIARRKDWLVNIQSQESHKNIKQNTEILKQIANNFPLVTRLRDGYFPKAAFDNQLPNDESPIFSPNNRLIFSPNNRYIISITQSDEEIGVISIRDIATDFNHAQLIKVSDQPIRALACSPNNRYLAIMPEGNSVLIYALEHFSFLQEIILHHEQNTRVPFATSLCFSPDSTILAIGTSNGNVEIRNTNNNFSLSHFLESMVPSLTARASARSLAFSPNGEILVAGIETKLQTWKVTKNFEMAPLQGLYKHIDSLTFLSENLLCMILNNHEVRISNMRFISNNNFQLEAIHQNIYPEDRRIQSVTSSSCGKYLFYANNQNALTPIFYNGNTEIPFNRGLNIGLTIGSYGLINTQANSLYISQNGQYAAFNDNGTLKISQKFITLPPEQFQLLILLNDNPDLYITLEARQRRLLPQQRTVFDKIRKLNPGALPTQLRQ